MKRIHWKRGGLSLYDATGLPSSLKKSLDLVILAVTFGMVNVNITTGAAWTGFLRLLGADAFALGVIAAIPVAASTLQMLASYVMERRGNRRELFICAGLISRLLWVPMGLVPFFVPMEAQSLRLVAVMVLLALSAGSGGFINVGFFSLVGDLVPMRIRGRYFSARQAVSLVASVLAGLFVSYLMDRTSGYGGYAVVLTMAGVFGALDIVCFFFVKWPPMQRNEEGAKPGFFKMLRAVWANKSFRRIIFSFTYWGFAVNISAPFFNVYMLEYMHMSYTEITLLNQVLPNICTVFAIGWWGKQMDRFGNKPILRLVGVYCALLPMLWVFTGPRSFWLMPVFNMLSGMSWPAFDLSTQNLYLGEAPAKNRSMYVAVYFASTQLFGNALSNAVGGYLVQNVLPICETWNLQIAGFTQTRYNYIFLLSGILRFGAVLFLFPKLTEVGSVSIGAMVRGLWTDECAALTRRIQRMHVAQLRRRARLAQEIEIPQREQREEKHHADGEDISKTPRH